MENVIKKILVSNGDLYDLDSKYLNGLDATHYVTVETIEENEEITAAALNDLNTRLTTFETTLLQLTNQILN